MDIKSMIDETIASGITPLRLKYDVIKYFDSNKTILRSSFIIQSLDIGILTIDQYRYVARRTKKGDELFKRLLNKTFEDYNNIKSKYKNFECIIFKGIPRMLLNGDLKELLFKTLAKFPNISPGNIGVELSSDILFENIDIVKQRIEEIKQLGVKVAMFEVGDEFCPIFRLSQLSLDYSFIDNYSKEILETEESKTNISSLISYLHLLKVNVFIPNIENDDEYINLVKNLQFDGYGINIPYTGKEV